MGEFETLGTVAEMQARLADLQRKSAEAHAARMAMLPMGTCDVCYGTKKVGGLSCRACTEFTVYAEGTPVEFQAATLANYRELTGNTTAIAKARTFLDIGTRDFYLTGGVGSGKTRLACSILNTAKRFGQWCYFARVPMMLHQMQPGRASEELEHVLMRCDLLVLDDLGAERDQASDYTRRTLLMVYEERGDRGHRTIFTSNKSVAELAGMQDDDRLSSRIAGRADVVKLSTSDQRVIHRVK
jgi:DNA replication protein DnaC